MHVTMSCRMRPHWPWLPCLRVTNPKHRLFPPSTWHESNEEMRKPKVRKVHTPSIQPSSDLFQSVTHSVYLLCMPITCLKPPHLKPTASLSSLTCPNSSYTILFRCPCLHLTLSCVLCHIRVSRRIATLYSLANTNSANYHFLTTDRQFAAWQLS